MLLLFMLMNYKFRQSPSFHYLSEILFVNHAPSHSYISLWSLNSHFKKNLFSLSLSVFRFPVQFLFPEIIGEMSRTIGSGTREAPSIVRQV